MKGIKLIGILFVLAVINSCDFQNNIDQMKACEQLDEFPSTITTLIGKVKLVRDDHIILDRIMDISSTRSSWKTIQLVCCGNRVKDAIIQNKDYKLHFNDKTFDGLWVNITGKLITPIHNGSTPQFLTNSVLILNKDDVVKYYMNP